jgi:methionine-rich copper-binding protein CopC
MIMRDLDVSKPVEKPQPHPEEAAFLGGWQQARPSKRPSFETRRKDAALLRMRCELLGALSALLLLPLGIGAAYAHAFLDHADPRVGNTVKTPRIVSLWFTQNLESNFSTIEVLDSKGTRMNAGNALVDTNDRKLLRVPVKVLPAGSYTVKWRVLSVDTHTSEGNFTFHVGP